MTFEAYSKELDTAKFERLSNSDLIELRSRVLADGDKQAWHKLWEHGLRMCLKIVNHMDERGILQGIEREDAVQEGNLAIGPALLSWEPRRGPYATWIWIKIRGAILDAEHQERVYGFTGSSVGDVDLVPNSIPAGRGELLLSDLYDGGTVEDLSEQSVLIRDVLSAMSRLSRRDRTYLYQVYIMGLPQADIARADGLSRQRVDQILSLALNRLRVILDK